MNAIIDNQPTKCGQPAPMKTENKVKRLIRRVIETVKPEHATVRFDSEASSWAVLKPDNSVQRHFIYGYMANAKFSVKQGKGSMVCGRREGGNYAVAEGDLYTESHSGPLTGFRNLRFDGSNMRGIDGQIITQTKAVRFMPGRAALYIPEAA